MSKRIGISFWGLLADFDEHKNIHIDTPDGHRYGRPLFIKELLSRGHEVFLLQDCRDDKPYPGVQYVNNFPELDIVFLEWRWSTYKNDRTHQKFSEQKYEPDLDRQRAILDHYHGNIPVIAWDTDLKITKEDEENYSEMLIADPSFSPKKITRNRTFVPFWTDWKSLFKSSEPYNVFGYVGNNYERDQEFQDFFFDGAKRLREISIQTSMYGNWLQPSPERIHPSVLINLNPYVAFNHRMNFYDSMKMMSKFLCTVHVSKEGYYKTGFLSPRYFEALACNCPALVPDSSLNKGFLGRDSIVNRDTVFHKVKWIADFDLKQREEFIEYQKASLKEQDVFDVKNVVDYIESCL